MRTWKGRRAVRGDYNFQWGRASVNAVAKGGKSRGKTKYVKLPHRRVTVSRGVASREERPVST